jgi:hypothetical protein
MLQRVFRNNAILLRPKLICTRNVHATWSILLNYEWIHDQIDEKSLPVGAILLHQSIIDEEPPINEKLTKTVMLIHSEFSNRTSCREVARTLLASYKSSKFYKEEQPFVCLLVDLRGHGGSVAEDYDAPHTVATATGDIIDLVGSIFDGKYIQQPHVVIGMGSLGSAVAANYLSSTLAGGMTENSHSELSGEGAIRVPTDTLLLPEYIPEVDEDEQEECDQDASLSLDESATIFNKTTLPDIYAHVSELSIEDIQRITKHDTRYVKIHEMGGKINEAGLTANIAALIDSIVISNQEQEIVQDADVISL